jgi:hypothetical protein
LNNAEAPVVIRPYGIVREQLEATMERRECTVPKRVRAHDSTRFPAKRVQTGRVQKGLFFVRIRRRW